MMRLALRGLVWLLAVAAVVYVGDWAIWRIRVARGGGMGSVEVNKVIIASLKGNKEAYYDDGTDTVACSRSIFPQAGAGACWWVERHREIDERY
jgi:hypothetical protein